MMRGPSGCWRWFQSRIISPRRRLSQRPRKRPNAVAPFAAEVELLEARAMLSGAHPAAAPLPAPVWTPLTNFVPGAGAGTMLLLTDGRVMIQGGGVSNTWSALSPDAAGNYVNGTFSPLASMSLQRLYMGSNVLPNGNVFLVGGEYSGPSGTQNFTPTGEIYDPVADAWSAIPNFPQSQFGDDPTMLLPNGKILAGFLSGSQTYLFDTATSTWSQTGTKLRGDQSDEETWTLLPDGSVLSYDIFSSIATGISTAQRYLPSTGTWVSTGNLPVQLSSSSVGFEIGPSTLLPDGRVFQVGVTGNTAYYTPSSNTWAAGPTLPAGLVPDDAPGAMLPNGHFIFAVDTPLFNAPTHLLDLDPVANTITDVTPTGALGSALDGPSFVDRMLVLPNGHMLLSTSSSQLWDYTPAGGPNSGWAPTVASVTPLGTGAFALTGMQLTGLSAGASYGDDANMDSNYPIVRLTNAAGVVKYARTTGWTPGVAAGAALQSVQFTMPAGFPPGGYHLSVIANGIASADFAFGLVGPQILTVTPVPPSQATLTWSQVTAADGYHIFLYNNVTHKNGKLLDTVIGSANTSDTVSGLAPGTQQYLVVEAFSATVSPFTADSAPVSISEPLPAPVVTVTYPPNNTTAVLHWSAIAPVQGYRLFMIVGTNKVLLGTLKPNSTSLALVGLKHGTTVQLMLEVFNGNVVADSTVISVTT